MIRVYEYPEKIDIFGAGVLNKDTGYKISVD